MGRTHPVGARLSPAGRRDTRQLRACVRFVPLVHFQQAPCVSCSGSAIDPVAREKEAMSYQPPPDYEAGTAAPNPPGWYLDPIGLQSLRWWDGAQWARDTQPLLGSLWQRPSAYPDAAPSASGGYGASGQPGDREGGRGDAPGLAPASFPSARMQAQSNPGQLQGTRGSPDRQSGVTGPPSPAHHQSRRGKRKHRGALTGFGVLIGSSSPLARRTRTARHRHEM